MSERTPLHIVDTTLRDGQQSPVLNEANRVRFSLEEKLQLIEGSFQLGVRHFEVFSPVVNSAEAEDLVGIRQYLDAMHPDSGVMLLAHVRCHPRDIEMALSAGVDGLNIFMGAADHTQHNGHGYSLPEMLLKVRNTVEEVRKNNPDLYMRYSVEDAFRTPPENIYAVFDVVNESVQTLGIPDTVGIATPETITGLMRELRTRYPSSALEGHFHNDYGYSLVNATTSVVEGMEYLDTSIWGLAERSGITSTTGILFNSSRHAPDRVNHYNLQLSYPVNVLMADILGLKVPWTEPVSLTNRTHVAGVHQKAVLGDNHTYEQNLAEFGVTEQVLLLGPLSGWHHIRYYLREVQYLDVSEESAQEIAKAFKDKAKDMNGAARPREILMELVEPYAFPSLLTKRDEPILENLGEQS